MIGEWPDFDVDVRLRFTSERRAIGDGGGLQVPAAGLPPRAAATTARRLMS